MTEHTYAPGCPLTSLKINTDLFVSIWNFLSKIPLEICVVSYSKYNHNVTYMQSGLQYAFTLDVVQECLNVVCSYQTNISEGSSHPFRFPPIALELASIWGEGGGEGRAMFSFLNDAMFYRCDVLTMRCFNNAMFSNSERCHFRAMF